MVLCKYCGYKIDEQPDIAPDKRSPCPSCGSTSRPVMVEVGGSVSPSGRLIAQKESTDGTEAIRVLDSQKRSSATDLDSNEKISYTIQGPSPKGEENTLDVCRVLINRLNLEGGQWCEPAKPVELEGGIDWEAKDGEMVLSVQVTRAVSNQDTWQQLGQSGNVASITTIENAADDLLARAREKARGVPRVQLSEIVLALDAMDTAGHTLKAVVNEFWKRHSATVRALGFKAIWIIGPLENQTSRLDVWGNNTSQHPQSPTFQYYPFLLASPREM